MTPSASPPARDRVACRLGRLAPLAALAAAALLPRSAEARPGTHAPATSTWDTRASSVVPSFTIGSIKGGGHLDYVSYNANFSSTTGNLSAQFGLHYANLNEATGDGALHGASGSAVALFSFPLASRYDNGVPSVALGLYAGAVPTLLTNGPLSYASLPLALGAGVPLAPAPWLTITPWGELSPSYDVDAKINTNPDWSSISDADKKAMQDQIDAALKNGDIAKAQQITEAGARQLASTLIQHDEGFHVGIRAGIAAEVHLDDDFSLRAHGMFWQLGGTEGKVNVIGGGAALVWRWDDIVPAVLPAETRLLRESCEAVAERFQLCPQYKEMQRPPAGPMSPVTPEPAPPAKAPAPAAPPSPSEGPGAPKAAPPAPPAPTPPGPTAPGAMPPPPSGTLPTMPPAPQP